MIDGEGQLAHVAFATRISPSVSSPVRSRDRVLNAIAAACIVAGAVLFLFARRTLTRIAAGDLSLPTGSAMTWVQYTDAIVLRSRIGIWLVVVGALLAVAAAISHRFQKRA
jgi:multisubunit Na+/H+ antiporter MnhB subunit